MTWIRIDCDLPDHPVIGLLAQALHIDTDKALACYARTLLAFGDHRIDGKPAHVADVTLEEWARWKGKAGKWAEAFRRLCIEQRAGQRDDPGVIKGWWRQRALLEKQLRDAARRKARPDADPDPPETPDKPPENPRGFSAEKAGNDDEDEDSDGTESSASSGARAPEPVISPVSRDQYVTRCTVACNRGLRDNPRVRTFNELVSSNQTEATSWFDQQIPIEVAEQAVYDRAKEYAPGGGNRQPRNLTYFRDVVPEAWERAQGRAQERRFTPQSRPVPPAAAEEEDEFVRAGRELDEQRAREKARANA